MIKFSKDLDFNEIINNNELVLFDFGKDNCIKCKRVELSINNSILC